MFKITGERGVHVRFANGYTLSVQWGPGNYCTHQHAPPGAQGFCGRLGSEDAEVAIIDPNGKLVPLPLEESRDTVIGWQSADDVMRWAVYAAALKA